MCTIEAAVAGASIMMARAESKSQIAFAEDAAREQREQIKDERTQLLIETTQDTNLRKEQMLETLATNRSLLSPSGMTEGSMSFQAFLASNKGKAKRDLNAIALNAANTRRDLSYKASDVERELLASKIKARGEFNKALLKGGATLYTEYDGYRNPPPPPPKDK